MRPYQHPPLPPSLCSERLDVQGVPIDVVEDWAPPLPTRTFHRFEATRVRGEWAGDPRVGIIRSSTCFVSSAPPL